MLRILQKRVTTGLMAQSSRMASNTVVDSPDLADDIESDPRKRVQRCLNRVTLIGRVGKDPEHRGNSTHPCIIFPLATNAQYRKADGERMVKTDWHRVAVFRPGLRDNIATKIMKGDRLFVEGSLSYVKYTDPDNKILTSVSINADEIMILQRAHNPGQASDEEN
ncbi:unnamed protein product [Candidula unifasciata]|uniref:Single-stranded DNA-binding protein, mitochondrial n=1 Tax=Candidula unifasciata TaxID=100452 RepID=A0A8S3ZYL0_9EUPU|nr:unnamed protein product [Candidula unifasciata]